MHSLISITYWQTGEREIKFAVWISTQAVDEAQERTLGGQKVSHCNEVCALTYDPTQTPTRLRSKSKDGLQEDGEDGLQLL